MAMFFVGMAATDIYVSSLPQMVKDFATTEAHVNLTLSVYFIGIAVSVLVVGELSNRYGRRNITLIGVAAYAIASFVIAFSPSLELIIAMRLIQAVGGAIIVIVPRLLLKDCLDEQEQIAANGVLLIGLILSPAIAPVIGAYLAKLFGWRSCFMFSGLMSAILVIIGYKILPETNQNLLPRFHSLIHYKILYTQVITNKVFWILSLIYASAVGAFFTFIGISSYLYIDHWHMSPELYASLYLWMSFAYLAGNQIMQFLNKQSVIPSSIIRIGVFSTFIGLIIILSSLVFSSTTQIILVTGGVIFLRAANALIAPPTQIKIMKYFDKSSAQALGLNMCLGFMCSSFATSIVSLFVKVPLFGLIIVSSLFILICIATFILGYKYIK